MTILSRLFFLDVDQEQHAGRILGDIVAERVAAEEGLECVARLGKPAGVEVGLAAGVELVGRRLVGIGAGLAGLANAQLARRTEMESSGFVGALDRRGQCAILTGKISVDVVSDRRPGPGRARSRK